MSPLITALTYEGLIDEMFGIENGRVRLDASIVGDDNAVAGKKSGAGANAVGGASEKVSVQLNNQDAVFAASRNLSIEKLGIFLQEKAIHIRERYTTFKGNKDASISEIHDFVKKIPKLTKEFKSLNQHINIAELLKIRTDSREFREQWESERGMLEGENYLDNIEEILLADTAGSNMYRVIKLLCIQSLTSGGIRAGRYDQIRRSIAQTYGFECLFTLCNLERSGLLKRKEALLVVETGNSNWQNLRKMLRYASHSLRPSYAM